MEDLIKCSKNGDLDRVASLLDSSPRPTQHILDEALILAIDAEHVAVVDTLLSHGARLQEVSFLAATRAKNTAIFQSLHRHGWDVNSTEFGFTALSMVIRSPECVELLLSYGADVNLTGIRWHHRVTATPMENVSNTNVVATARMLVEHGAIIPPTALVNTVKPRGARSTDMLKFLLEAGAELNAVDNYHQTALFWAALIKDYEKAQLLLAAGADKSIKSYKGRTPYEEAMMAGDTRMAELLS